MQECESENLPKYLDVKAGDWKAGNVDFALEVYNIANKCLMQEKKKRPEMIEVYRNLVELADKLS